MTSEKINSLTSKISLIISIFAFVLSGLSFWKSQLPKNENSIAYIEVIDTQFLDMRLRENNEYFIVTAKTEITNTGNIPTTIRYVGWQTLNNNVPDEIKSHIRLIASDVQELSPDLDINNLEIRYAQINSPTINPKETKTIYFYFQSHKLDTLGQSILGESWMFESYLPDFVIVFENGQIVIAKTKELNF
jgi:hypothetical protein